MRRTQQTTEQRRAHHRQGVRAETLAVWLLRLKGYMILDRRVKTGVGEIDIVAKRFRRLAFVEVKDRPSSDEALLAVTRQGQERMMRASQAWLKRWPQLRQCEPVFDLVLVVPGRLPRHVRDAFGAADALADRRR